MLSNDVEQHVANYLRAMCEDLPYEVVTRVEDLPISLLSLSENHRVKRPSLIWK